MKNIANSRFARLGLTGVGIILACVIIHAFTSSVAFAQPDAADKVVSYKVVSIDLSSTGSSTVPYLEEQLKVQGQSGWHLVAIDHSLYIFSK